MGVLVVDDVTMPSVFVDCFKFFPFILQTERQLAREKTIPPREVSLFSGLISEQTGL